MPDAGCQMPDAGWWLDARDFLRYLHRMPEQMFQFGMIGLGVMGSNLLLNMADHQFPVIGYDINPQKTRLLESSARKNTIVKGASTLKELVEQLERPRRIMMLVPAGKPVDNVIANLLPLLSEGDILIDGGNSHFVDTKKRIEFLLPKNIHFMGMGVSGGEMGARLGPSMMPGGDVSAWQSVKPYLEVVVAKVNDEPCIDYLGSGAAGHYVKMVHNGIEYAIMQLISEAYQLLHTGCGLDNDALHEIFNTWNETELQSFLVEITADIFLQKDPKTKNRLVDMILDKAGSKGTGKWTSQDAMDLGVPIPSIDAAVSARNISALKTERQMAAVLYNSAPVPLDVEKDQFIAQLKDALYLSMLLCYGQGFSLLQEASAFYNLQIPLSKVLRVWRGGCIIRSAMLQIFIKLFDDQPGMSNILLDRKIASIVIKKVKSLRDVVCISTQHAYASPAFSNSLNYLDAYCTGRLPANLLQAQRDYFGAHTYERVDEAGIFHTEWGKSTEP
jgi:6-phosphogluconate dehydrogenase